MQTPTELAPGNWGGQHIGLEVRADGAALEFDCAHGEIKGRIALDRLGRFRAAGGYVAERGGPVRSGGEEKSQAVIYSGQIRGERMTLTILDEKTQKRIGRFTLRRGEEAFIVKCK